jgi:hypothetical protein
MAPDAASRLEESVTAAIAAGENDGFSYSYQ